MANTLMFEVGVKEAGNQLTNLETRLKSLVETYGSLKIKVEVENLKDFVNALKLIGEGKQLKPLLDRIDALQTSLTKINGSMGNVDLYSLKKQVQQILDIEERIKKTSNDLKARGATIGQVNNATATDRMLRDTQLRTLEKNFGMTVEAAKHYIKTSENAGDASTKLERKIEQLSQSISGLAAKTPTINLGGDFANWAQQVNGVTAAVRELVEQLKQLHKVQGQSGAIKSQTEQLFEQAKLIDSINSQLNKLYIKGTKIPNQLTPADDAEMKRLESERTAAQAKFNELLSQGSTVANSYAQTIQQLGQKYNHTAEQAQKLTSLISGGELKQNEVMRKLGVGFYQAKDIVDTINAVQKLKQVESQPVPQVGLFDQQKFTTLQEAIDKIITEITRLKEAFAGIGKIDGLTEFKTSINGIQVEVNNLLGVMSKLSGAMHVDKSAEEIAAWEKKIQELKSQYDNLLNSVKQVQDGMKMVASGKGSEATQNTNLDTLNAQLNKAKENLAKMETEYNRMTAAGAQNDALKGRIDRLKDYIEWLKKVKDMDLSKAGALKATDVMFDGNLLFGQVNKQMYSDKAVKEFSKIVDETLKGKAAADAMNEAFERMKQKMIGVGTAGSGGMRGVSAMMETINTVGERNIQTLIKERAHVKRLIAMAEKSIRFGEGHDVAGMQGLRVQQRENLEYLNNVKNAINHILENRNTPEWMQFLNTTGSLRIPLAGSGNDIALLGGHFDALTHSVTGTSQAMRQLNKDMRLDNLTKQNKDWNTNQLKLGLDNVKTQIENIKAAWDKVGDGADAGLTRSVAQMMNGLNDLKTKIASAMQDDSLLGSRRGYMQVLNADSEILLKNAKAMTTQLTQLNSEREKAEARQLREADKFTEQSKKAYAQAEKEKAAAIKQTEKEQEAARKKQEQADNQAIKDMQTRETGQRRYNGLLKDMHNLMDKLDSRKSLGSSLNIDTTKTEQAMQRLQQFIDKTLNMDVRNFGDRHYITEYAAEWAALKKELVEVANAQKKANDAQERLNNASQKASARQAAQAAKDSAADNKKWADSMNKASIEATKLESKLQELQRAEKRLSEKGIDTTQLKESIEQIRQNLAILQSMAAGAKIHGTTRDFVGSSQFQNPIIQANATLKQLNAQATSQLSTEEQKLAQAIGHSSDSMKNQSQILSDLKTMAMQYVSVWGAQSFINNIIEIGGQLEKQRLSIAAILQDAAHGEDLFDKIKRLAVQSPFGVVELDQFTKQLSAYGFKYNELYDMTKRLADISAGAGTEVSRLALALGHVRAEGALSGYTLRQFAMNNIPMVTELAKKLSEVEGHLVTTADVRKRVSNKEIGYSDVEDVIKKLTDEGGMFYKMQEVISESVAARWKNLRDSLDIMYGEIAKSSVGDLLKDIAVSLTNLTRSWKTFIPIVKAGAIAFVGYRAGLLAVNMAMGKNAAATVNSIMTYKRRRAAELQQEAMIRKLTIGEEKLIQTSNRLSASDIKVAISSDRMTRGEALKLVALRKVDLETAKALIRMGEFSAAEIRMALNGNILGMNLGKLGAQIKLFGASIASSFASLGRILVNPWNLGFAALSAYMEMSSRQEQYEEDRRNRLEELWRRSSEGQKNLSEMVATYQVGLSAKTDEDGLKQAISDLKEKLKDYMPDVNSVFNEAFKVGHDVNIDGIEEHKSNVHSLAEQYEILAQALKDTAESYRILATTKVEVDDAIESTQVKFKILGKEFASPFDNNVTANIKKYSDAVKEADAALMGYFRDYREETRTALAAAGQKFDETDVNGMKNAVSGLKKLSDEWKKFAISLQQNDNAVKAFDNLDKKTEKQKKAWSDLSNDIMTMGNRLFDNLTEKWGNVSSWTEQQRMAVYMIYDDIIGKELEAAGVSKETQADIRRLFMEPFGVKFQTETEEAYKEINELKEYLENITNTAWVIKLKVESSDSVEIIDQARKLRKSAKEGAEELRKDIKKAGLLGALGKDGSIELGKAKTPAEEKMLKDYQKKLEEQKNAEKTLDSFYADYETEKDKNKNKNKGKGEDKNAKEIRERVRIIKEAADSFQYWRQKVGEKGAWSHVLDEFGDVLKKIGITADNVQDLRGNLDKIKNSVEFKAIKDPKVKLETEKEISKEKSQLNRKDFEKSADEFVSSMNREIEELTQKWEIFNSVVSSTGDRLLAARMSGISPGATPADLKRTNVARFAGVKIDFDRVYGMSDKEIDEYVFSLGIAENKIAAIQTGLKDWKKAQQDITKSDIQDYAKWLGGLVDLQSILTRNQEEYNATLEETNRLLQAGMITHTEANTRKQSAWDKRMSADWQASTMYSRLYNNSQQMAKGEFNAAYQREIQNLNSQLSNGTLTVEQYTEKIDKLNQIQREFSTKGFLGIQGGLGAYLGGGFQGYVNYRKGKAADLRKQGDIEGSEKEYAAVKSLEKMQQTAEQVTKVFSDLSQGAEMLSGLFDALGMGDASNAMSDAGGILGGMAGGASSLAGLGPWGMAAGAAIGGLTSIAQLHDKQQQRVIDALKEEVNALEMNTEAIKKARERTLGYDYGTRRAAMAGLYRDSKIKDYFSSMMAGYDVYRDRASIVAMREYYTKNGSGSGYQQELANLKEEREKYLEMYDAENGKKKKSQDSLDEYTKKIAELDDQISNYVQDLTNELWGIDFKSWADQISDALWTAFENGEDAVKAFRETATDIIADVAKRMMNLHFIEPAFEQLEEKLFGKLDKETGKRTGGVAFNSTTGQLDEEATLKVLGEFLGEGGVMEKQIEGANTFYELAKQAAGVDFKSEDSSKSTGSSIKGVSEQTADLLAGYINAIRADVSVNRAMIAQYFPLYYSALTNGNASLRNIETNTEAIMRSNDRIAERISNLDDNINGLKNRTWQVPIA